MKKEIFRMINIITNSTEAANLDDMNLYIHQGEIVGLIPINGIGVEIFLEMFSGPIPVKFGKIYINNKPFNNRHPSRQQLNKVYILNQKRKLVDSLSVLENIYVLNSLPFCGIIRREPLLRQYAWLTENLNLHISPETRCEKLTEIDRCIVELLKAITQGSQLIVLHGISDILSGAQLESFKDLLIMLSGQNYSFLYICSRYEESLSFCNRIIYMKDGKDIQSFDHKEIDSLRYLKFSQSLLSTDPLVNPAYTETALHIRHIPTAAHGEFSFDIKQGECVVLYDETKELQREFADTLYRNHGNLKGLYEISDSATFLRLDKSVGKQICIIGENPLASMIFYDMSYIDNLCFRMENKIKRIHVSGPVKRSIQKEYFPFIGNDIYASEVDKLSPGSLYNLVYYRIALLNPKAVFIIQPFYNTDIYLKKHIRDLIHMLQKRRIAIIILSADLLDSVSIANRRLIMESGAIQSE